MLAWWGVPPKDKTLVDPPGFRLEDVIPGAPPTPIEVVFDRATLPPKGRHDPASRYRALEVWTRNRIYMIDANMTCIEVCDRKTGIADAAHQVLGARLTGGQRRYGKTMHISRPFPVPGTEAVFQRDGVSRPAGVTSKVERVVLRITVTSLVIDENNAWDDVTSALLLPENLRR